MENERPEQNQNEPPQDGQSINNNQNNNEDGNENENNLNNNILVDDDINTEMNNNQNNNQNNQYPQGQIEDDPYLRVIELLNHWEFFGKFIFKVYGLFSFHLLAILILLFISHREPIKTFFLNHILFTIILFIISFILFFYIMFLFIKNKNIFKIFPKNYIALLVITLVISSLYSFITLKYLYQFLFLFISLILISSTVISIAAYFGQVYTWWTFIPIIPSQLLVLILMNFILDISKIEMFFCIVVTILYGMYLDCKISLLSEIFNRIYSVDDYIIVVFEFYEDISTFIRIIIDLTLRAVSYCLRRST